MINWKGLGFSLGVGESVKFTIIDPLEVQWLPETEGRHMRPSRTALERQTQDPIVNPERTPLAMPLPKELHNKLGDIASQLSTQYAALEDLVNKNEVFEGSALEDALTDLENTIDHVNRVLEDEA